MNIAYDLLLLLFNLTQLHDKKNIVKLFLEGMSEAFKPAEFSFSEKIRKQNELEFDIRTRKSVFGYIAIKNAEVIPNEHKTLIQNAVQMLAVILERLVFDENLREEKKLLEKIAEKRNDELKTTIGELQKARKASLNLIEDLTEENEKRKKSEKKLRNSEERFRSLFEMMAEGVVYQNAVGEIISANHAAEEILGLSIKQMLGRKSIDPRWKAVDKNKNELPGEKHPAMVALKTGKPVEGFIQGIFNPKTNNYVWIIVNSIPQFEKNSDKPVQVFSTFLDITDRVTAEEELNRLKDNLQQEVDEKTKELNERVEILERFHDATIEREFRIKELRKEIEQLKKENNDA